MAVMEQEFKRLPGMVTRAMVDGVGCIGKMSRMGRLRVLVHQFEDASIPTTTAVC